MSVELVDTTRLRDRDGDDSGYALSCWLCEPLDRVSLSVTRFGTVSV
jgi:hypothetical protein